MKEFLSIASEVIKKISKTKRYRMIFTITLLFLAVITSIPAQFIREPLSIISCTSVMINLTELLPLISFAIVLLFLLQAVSLILCISFIKVSVILSAAFEIIWERILMASPYLFLIFVILSNMSSESWFSTFYDYMLKCPPIVQCSVTVFFIMNLVIVCAFFKQWIVNEYKDDHSLAYDIPTDGIVTYEQYKSQKERVSNR